MSPEPDTQQIACLPLLHSMATPGATTHDKLLPSHHSTWCHYHLDPNTTLLGMGLFIAQPTKTCRLPHPSHPHTMSGSNYTHPGERASPSGSFGRSAGPEKKWIFHSRKLWVPQGIDSQASQEEKEAAFRVERDTPGAEAAGLNAGSWELQGIALDPGHASRGCCCQEQQ